MPLKIPRPLRKLPGLRQLQERREKQFWENYRRGRKIAKKGEELAQRSWLEHLPQKPHMTRYLFKHLNLDRFGPASSFRELRNPFTVVTIDGKGLTALNNKAGRSTGDEGLRLIAKTMKEVAAEEEGLPVHYAGDDFTLILPTDDKQRVEAALGRFRQRLQARIESHPNPIFKETGFDAHAAYMIFTHRDKLAEGFAPIKLVELEMHKAVRQARRSAAPLDFGREYINLILALSEGTLKAAKQGSKAERDAAFADAFAKYKRLPLEVFKQIAAKHLDLAQFEEELAKKRRAAEGQ